MTDKSPFLSGSHETRRFSQPLLWETRWRVVDRCLCVMRLCQIVPDTPANKNAASATPDIMLLFPLMVRSLQWHTIKDANSASKANPIFWGEGAQVRTPFCSPLWWVSYVLSFCPKYSNSWCYRSLLGACSSWALCGCLLERPLLQTWRMWASFSGHCRSRYLFHFSKYLYSLKSSYFSFLALLKNSSSSRETPSIWMRS